jgi:hypothetical protein
MKSRLTFLTLMLLTPLLLSPTSSSQTPADAQQPLYRPTGKEAKLMGSITVNGIIPKPRTIDMTADPICIELNAKPETEHLIANAGGLLNVFVYVKSNDRLSAYRFEQPDSEVVLQRKNCHYVPRLLALRVGQPLSIVNLDPTYHNTHPTPRLNVEWNQTQAPSTPPLVKTFPRAEQLIPFKCNQHPWERAYVAVMDHPFFAITNEFGNYEIGGLPPGAYTLVAWHEQLGEQQLELNVVAGEMRRIDFSFKVVDKKASSSSVFRSGKDQEVVQRSAIAAGSFPGK